MKVAWTLAWAMLVGCSGDTATERDSSTDSGADTETGTDTDIDTAGFHATGSYAGVPVAIDCAPPTDLVIGVQFLYQYPSGLFHLWTARCRTEDQSIQIWLDIANPVVGTVTQPAAGDSFNIALGDPYDVMPPSRYSSNLTAMSLTIDAVDVDTLTLVGSFTASWSDDGSGKYGEISGTFDIVGWQ